MTPWIDITDEMPLSIVRRLALLGARLKESAGIEEGCKVFTFENRHQNPPTCYFHMVDCFVRDTTCEVIECVIHAKIDGYEAEIWRRYGEERGWR